jgi:Xaa-Pro aminopeptidase
MGFRSAHCRDAVAMIRFLAWLDEHASARVVTETEASDKLQSFRQQVDGYLGDSFGAISASGEHGAIVHYRANPGH